MRGGVREGGEMRIMTMRNDIDTQRKSNRAIPCLFFFSFLKLKLKKIPFTHLDTWKTHRTHFDQFQ